MLDQHAQLLNPDINRRLRIDRSIHEVLGMAKGIIADGEVSELEVTVLRDWFRANPETTTVWPGYVLAERLERIFEDGVVTEEERRDLRELLEVTAGGGRPGTDEINASTELPIDDPPPELVFEGRTFLFTGKFIYGTRARCEAAVRDRGGICVNRLNRSVSYLVIGCIGSRDWIHTSWGRKIEGAVKLREKGLHVPIVSEEHWSRHVQDLRNS